MRRISVYVEDHLEERVLGAIRVALSDNGVPSYDLTSEPAKEKERVTDAEMARLSGGLGSAYEDA